MPRHISVVYLLYFTNPIRCLTNFFLFHSEVKQKFLFTYGHKKDAILCNFEDMNVIVLFSLSCSCFMLSIHRQAELLERRRIKKLRQREQKTKGNKANDEVSSSCTVGNPSGSLETPYVRDESDECTPEASKSEDCNPFMPIGLDPDGETHPGLHLHSEEAVQETDQQEKQLESASQLPVPDHLPPCKQAKAARHGTKKYRNMVWTPKAKFESGNQPSHEVDRTDREQLDGTKNSEVLIGSISVALAHSNGHSHESISPLTSPNREKLLKPEIVKSIALSSGKQWIPVIRHEDGDSILEITSSIENMEDRLGGSSAATANQSPHDDCHLVCNEIRVNDAELCKDLLVLPRIIDSPSDFVFSSTMADAFLSQSKFFALSSVLFLRFLANSLSYINLYWFMQWLLPPVIYQSDL